MNYKVISSGGLLGAFDVSRKMFRDAFERSVERWRAVRSIAGADCVWDNDNSPDMFVDAG